MDESTINVWKGGSAEKQRESSVAWVPRVEFECHVTCMMLSRFARSQTSETWGLA